MFRSSGNPTNSANLSSNLGAYASSSACLALASAVARTAFASSIASDNN